VGYPSTDGLNSYDKDCLFDSLKSFKIPHTQRWDYSIVICLKYANFVAYFRLHGGRLFRLTDDSNICTLQV
jgi:hypothetical protein